MKSNQEVKNKKKKSITLKVSIDEKKEPSKEDENLVLITRKFKKFITFEKNKGRKFYPKKDSQKKVLG